MIQLNIIINAKDKEELQRRFQEVYDKLILQDGLFLSSGNSDDYVNAIITVGDPLEFIEVEEQKAFTIEDLELNNLIDELDTYSCNALDIYRDIIESFIDWFNRD